MFSYQRQSHMLNLYFIISFKIKYKHSNDTFSSYKIEWLVGGMFGASTRRSSPATIDELIVNFEH